MTYEEISSNIKQKRYEVTNGKSERDFFEDLVEAFNLDAKDPVVSRMYSMAWENGHSYGYNEVLIHFHDLVGVFKG